MAAHNDPALQTIAHELSLYLAHYSVSGSLRNVLAGEDEQFCEAYFVGTRKGRYSDILRLVVATLPAVAYGSKNAYNAWLARFE